MRGPVVPGETRSTSTRRCTRALRPSTRRGAGPRPCARGGTAHSGPRDREQAGGDVTVDVRALFGRRLAQPGVELDATDLCLHHRRVRAPLRPGVVAAPAVDRAVDQARASRPAAMRASSPYCSSAPGRKFSSTTSLASASSRASAAPRSVLQVERDGPLPCVDPREVDAHRVVADLGLQEADDVAARRFQLHHVGAEVGEHAPADRTGDDLRQVENRDPFEWASVEWSWRHACAAAPSGVSFSLQDPDISGPPRIRCFTLRDRGTADVPESRNLAGGQ